MRCLLPCLLFPILTAAHAESHSTDLLNQISQEAQQTTLVNNAPAKSSTVENEPSGVTSGDVDVEKLTLSIAGRLAEILGTDTKTDPEQLNLSLETVVSNALRDGKQMEEIRKAVAQAMKDVTGQELALNEEAISASRQEVTPATQDSTIIQTDSESISSLETVTTPVVEGPRTTTVLPGESLFRVAQRVYGEENGRRFLELFEANRDIIQDINVVHEGQVLTVPE